MPHCRQPSGRCQDPRRPGDSGGARPADPATLAAGVHAARRSRRGRRGFPARVAGSPGGVRHLSRESGRVGGEPLLHTRPQGADVSPPSRTRQVVRAIADGTGLTVEEVWIKAGVTVVVVTVLGVLRTVELVLDLVADISDLARE